MATSTFDQLVADLTRDAQRVQPKDALQFCASWFQTRLEEQRARLRDAIAANAFAARDLPLDVYRDTPMGPNSSSSISSITSSVATSYGAVEVGISPLSQVPPQPMPMVANHMPPLVRPPSLPPTATSSAAAMSSAATLTVAKRSSLRKSSSFSPFGTLNVPGNALLSDNNNNGISNSAGNGVFNSNYRLSMSGPSHGTSTSSTTPSYTPRFVLDGQEIPPTSLHDTSNPNPFASFSWNNNNDGSAVSPNHHRVASDDAFLPLPDSAIFARRKSVSAESIAVDSSTHEPLPVHTKTPEQLRRIKACISSNLIFRDLDEEQETGVLNAMHERRVDKGEVVIQQGDTGDYFYVVESGLLHCFIRPESPAPWQHQHQQLSRRGTAATTMGSMSGLGGAAALLSPAASEAPGELANSEEEQSHPEYGKKVAENKPGTSFGELALMYGHPRAATVVAVEPSTLWSLDRITFRTIILKAAHRRRTMYEQFLSSVTLLSSLEPEERSKVADALVSRVYQDGEAVVRQGEPGNAFFFVEEGEAVVTKTTTGPSGEPREIEVMRYKKGDYFGGGCYYFCFIL
jgi:cAMP-dependent protein kinase regulator